MSRVIGIGVQDFETIRKNNYFYVDKTDFIREWWKTTGATVTLIARPRRFGKTLTMNTVNRFFSNEFSDQEELFSGLAVWQDEDMRAEAGHHPVISMTWSGIKGGGYHDVREDIIENIRSMYDKYRWLAESPNLDGATSHQIADFSTKSLSDSEAVVALRVLCQALHQHYGVKPIVLLDEYDTPLQDAWTAGYWDDLVIFLKKLMNFTFKSNESLHRAIITGVTRVSKESIFSDLNNPQVVTTTTKLFQTTFGFTEQEVFAALDEYGIEDLATVKLWYDGFSFGTARDIYNPWSITNLLQSKTFACYWANTSSNELVGQLIRAGNSDTKSNFEDLLLGKTVRVPVTEEISFRDLDSSVSAVWSLLLATGYLKVVSVSYDMSGQQLYELALTNLEVKMTFDVLIRRWFDDKKAAYNGFIKALLSHDIEAMNITFSALVRECFSAFDATDHEPERFYHGFVLGLLVTLRGRFAVKSNRESGYGRYDVMLSPVDVNRDDGYIFEFKVKRSLGEKTLEASAQAALKQIADRCYEADLVALGLTVERIHKYGFAFEGKRVLIAQ